MLVTMNERGSDDGIPGYSGSTRGPILQDTPDNPLWKLFHASYDTLVLADRRSLIAYAHESLEMPAGEETLAAELSALVAEGAYGGQ